MSANVTYPRASHPDQKLSGAMAEPPGAGKVGAVVVLQEWHGVNAAMRAMVDRFAAAGYLALCPDLYHGEVATTDEQAMGLMKALDFPKAAVEVSDAAAYLRGHARSNGKVGVAGFCMGGALALFVSVKVEGLACALPFYGLPQLPPDAFSGVKTPIEAHFAKHDDWAKASGAEAIAAKVRAGGGHMDVFVYDAGHAFMRAGDPSHYDEAAAKLAWPRATAFLGAHLG